MDHIFFLQKWSVWPPIQQDENDEASIQSERLSFIPKMLRRRLTPLAKIVFSAAGPCVDENKNIPAVFSSTHGELAKSFAMMEMIEAGEEISPTTFSLSVHNSIAGLFSMVYKNKLQATVVAPGEEGMAAAFIEALGLMEEGAEEVLIIFYDEPLVGFYPSEPFQLSSKHSCAIALKVSKSGDGLPIHFRQLKAEGVAGGGEQPIQVQMLIKFLADSEKKLLITTTRHNWCWERR